MTTRIPNWMVLCACVLGCGVFAAGRGEGQRPPPRGEGPRPPPPPRGERQRPPPPREELTKRFDADGDGELSRDEITAAKAERAEQADERDEPRERPKAGGPEAGPNIQELIKQFDADGDGKLSDEEHEALENHLHSLGIPCKCSRCKHEHGDKGDKPGHRPERPGKPDAGRPRPDGPKPECPPEAGRPERPRPERPEAGRPERPARPEGARPERPSRPEGRPERPEGGRPGNRPTHGNNGLGNGQDPQPLGNPPVNDGAGTSPGNPGNRK